jgi:hypothetical protein
MNTSDKLEDIHAIINRARDAELKVMINNINEPADIVSTLSECIIALANVGNWNAIDGKNNYQNRIETLYFIAKETWLNDQMVFDVLMKVLEKILENRFDQDFEWTMLNKQSPQKAPISNIQKGIKNNLFSYVLRYCIINNHYFDDPSKDNRFDSKNWIKLVSIIEKHYKDLKSGLAENSKNITRDQAMVLLRHLEYPKTESLTRNTEPVKEVALSLFRSIIRNENMETLKEWSVLISNHEKKKTEETVLS